MHKPVETIHDDAEVLSVAEQYPKAFRTMDAELARGAFLPTASKLGFFYDYDSEAWMPSVSTEYSEIEAWVLEHNKDGVMPDTPPKATLLDRQDKIAVVKLELEWTPGKWGCDYVLLVKESGRWRISHSLWQSVPT